MSYADWKARLATGNAFDDDDVARCYAYRPPYAPALYDRLLELVPRKHQLVDLGCGPGKVAAALAPHFTRTLALDPAAAMVDHAKRLHPRANIHWLHARAEDAPLPGRIDLVTAGTAIHWMQHDVLFPRLAERTNLLAIISLSAPPPWADANRAFMSRWLEPIGQVFDEAAFSAKNRTYERWLDIAGRRTFTVPFEQSAGDYVAHMHSTATFSRSRMGADLTQAFDDDLVATLRPFARNGLLAFDVASELVWGAPRRYARAQEDR